MDCPKCRKPMSVTPVREIEVESCPDCRGIWFDETELERMLGLTPAELRPLRRGPEDAALDRVVGRCPKDGSQLTRVTAARQREVTVDVCPKCRGIWLDGGEFDRLRA